MRCFEYLLRRWQFCLRANVSAITVALMLLVFTTGSQAKIVYTPVDVTIGSGGDIKIDLNHDGIKDFDIKAAGSGVYCGMSSGGFHGVVTVTPRTGDGVVASGGNAAALASGIHVGSGLTFDKYAALMTNFQLSRGCGFYIKGNWCAWNRYAYSCSKTGYLGFEFLVNGQTHYGWAYVTISADILGGGFHVTLKGFAYETIAGQGITTGQTTGV